ncbi:MAG: tetratricopeptide repeat protein [Flavobacteriales bacterium]|nr:tetratricopeptide repeat protein [Flavobacteriales bacterium]
MMVLRMGLLVVLSAYMHLGIAQTPRELAWADSLLEQLAGHMQDDARRAAELAKRVAFTLEQAGDPCKALHVRSLLANYLDRLGSVDSAAALFLDDRFARIATCPPSVQKDYYRCLTNVQLSLGEFMRVDSVCTLAYGLADAGTLKGMDLSELRCNHGIAVASMGRLEEAMILFRSAYDDARAHASMENMTNALLNTATIHAMTGDREAARRNYEEVLDLLRVGGFSDQLVRCYQNLGSIHKDLGNLDKAIAYQDSAIALARTSGFLQGEADATHGLAQILRARSPRNDAYDQPGPLPAAPRQHPGQRPDQGGGGDAREVRDREERTGQRGPARGQPGGRTGPGTASPYAQPLPLRRHHGAGGRDRPVEPPSFRTPLTRRHPQGEGHQ